MYRTRQVSESQNHPDFRTSESNSRLPPSLSLQRFFPSDRTSPFSTSSRRLQLPVELLPVRPLPGEQPPFPLSAFAAGCQSCFALRNKICKIPAPFLNLLLSGFPISRCLPVPCRTRLRAPPPPPHLLLRQPVIFKKLKRVVHKWRHGQGFCDENTKALVIKSVTIEERSKISKIAVRHLWTSTYQWFDQKQWLKLTIG